MHEKDDGVPWYSVIIGVTLFVIFMGLAFAVIMFATVVPSTCG